MNNKCKNLKQGFNKLKCKRTNKEITLSECINCRFYDRKVSKGNYSLKSKSVLKCSKTPLKKVSKKHAKSEKDRYSIFTTDLEHCYFCKLYNNKEIPRDDLHEIFRGARRSLSKKYGAVLPTCRTCHENETLINEWRKIGQKECMKYYNWTKEEFIKVFGKNYLD